MICLIIIISIFAHLTKKRKEEKKTKRKKKRVETRVLPDLNTFDMYQCESDQPSLVACLFSTNET